MYLFSYKLRKILGFCAFFALFCGEIWAQDQTLLTDLDLSKTPYAWLSVLSGAAVCEPIKTSYGWLDLTEGKMASAFSESGAVLWQKSIPAQAAGMAAADTDDFSFVILKGKRLCLLNPSGLVLWQRALDFEPKAPPLVGRDGRIYLFGKDSAACFGMNGVQKWKEKFEPLSSKLEPDLLDDGSLVLFLEAEREGKTCALRVSPFGELLERIVFAGRVTGRGSLDDGLLLSFFDGTVGLCSVRQNEAKSVWVIKGLDMGQSVRFFSAGANKMAALSCGTAGSKVAVIDAKKAEAECVFVAADIKELKSAFPVPDGIFLAAADCGALYSLGGKKVRGALFPKKTKKFNWDYVLYAKNGTLLFTSKNWSLAGWRLIKASQAQKPPAPGANKKKGLKEFYKNQKNDHSLILEGAGERRKAALEKGNYGAAEKDFLFASAAILDGFFEKAAKKNSVGGSIGAMAGEEIFSFSLAQESAAIGMLGLYGSREAAAALARVLRSTKDESVLTSALKAVQDCGYDPDGAIMDSIETLAKGALPSQENLLKEICGSLYSVCRFMGRPVLYKKGLKILAALQFPQYPNSTKEEARKVYEKLAKLQL